MAIKIADVAPVKQVSNKPLSNKSNKSNKPDPVSNTAAANKPDRKAYLRDYMREYMRKRRVESSLAAK